MPTVSLFSFLVFMLFTFLAFFIFIMDRTSSIMLIKSGRCPYLLLNLRGKLSVFLLLTMNLWAFVTLSYIPEGNTFICSLLPLSLPTTCRALWSEKIKVYIHIYIYVGTDNFKSWMWLGDWTTANYVVVQSPSHVWLFVTPWTATHQASLSLIISQSLP